MKSSRRWVRPNWFSSRRANFLILLRCYLTSWVGARLKLSDVFQSGRGIQSFLGETGAWEWVQEKFVLGVGRNGEPGLEEKPISGGERAAVRGKEKRPGQPHSLTLSLAKNLLLVPVAHFQRFTCARRLVEPNADACCAYWGGNLLFRKRRAYSESVKIVISSE